MGNATTRLQVRNATSWQASLSIVVNEPRHRLGSRTVSYDTTIAPLGRATIEIHRNSIGHVKAMAVLTYLNGPVVRFEFGVVDHDCEDTIVLEADRVIYNNVPRGTSRDSSTKSQSTRAVRDSTSPYASSATQAVCTSSSSTVSLTAAASGIPSSTQVTVSPLTTSTTEKPTVPRVPLVASPLMPSESPLAMSSAVPPSPYSTLGETSLLERQNFSANPALFPFPMGAKVFLTSMTSGRNLRIREDGVVDANGGKGPLASFIISPNHGYLRLQNLKHPDRFLAIRGGYLTYSDGDLDSELFAKQVGPDMYVLRAVHTAAGVGFLADGQPTLPADTHEGPYAQFMVSYAS